MILNLAMNLRQKVNYYLENSQIQKKHFGVKIEEKICYENCVHMYQNEILFKILS